MKVYSQHIDKNINRENESIKACYEHFSQRYLERFGTSISFSVYWVEWISHIRGYYVSSDKSKMTRMIGSYTKQEKIFKIVYKKISDIYVPLTIYEIPDHKRQFRMYMKTLKHKNGR